MVRGPCLVQLVPTPDVHLGAGEGQVLSDAHLVCSGVVGHIEEQVLGVGQVTSGGMGKSCGGTFGFFELELWIRGF